MKGSASVSIFDVLLNFQKARSERLGVGGRELASICEDLKF
jgi:hypothetical protein